MKKLLIIFCYTLSIELTNVFGESKQWSKGVIETEYLFKNTTLFQYCHASTIADTPNGLVAAWFGGTAEGNPDVVIWLSRKQSNNNTWTTPVEVANGVQSETFRYACWNPVLFQIPDGDLLLFYRVGPRSANTTGWMKQSSDSGITWSAARQLPNGLVGPFKNKPILLDNGDLLCPSTIKVGANLVEKVVFDITPDFGENWMSVGPLEFGEEGGDYEAEQPTILVHENQTLQILCRSKTRAILESWSTDNGQTWTPFAKTKLPNNYSGLDSVSLTDGRKLLAYNHVLPPADKVKGDRSPLNVALSYDGVDWFASLVLEDEPDNQYSYPSVIQSSDGRVHIVYSWKKLNIKHVEIDPSMMVMRKIEDGVWPTVNDTANHPFSRHVINALIFFILLITRYIGRRQI